MLRRVVLQRRLQETKKKRRERYSPNFRIGKTIGLGEKGVTEGKKTKNFTHPRV